MLSEFYNNQEIIINVEAGKRSLAFSLVYRAIDKTLKDSDVDPIHDKIRQSLTKQFAVELPS